jgi:hypothetical protein
LIFGSAAFSTFILMLSVATPDLFVSIIFFN